MAVSNNQINTEIGVSINERSIRSVKELTRDINQLGRETKVAETQFKSQGDVLNATKAKYDGLTMQVRDQKAKVAELRREEEQITGTTEKDAQAKAKLRAEIAKAENQLGSFVNQQQKAQKQYDYEASGLGKLTRQRQLDEKAVNAEVAALRAEGKEQEANNVKREGTKRSIQNLSATLDKQNAELDKLKKNGATTEQVKKQEIYVAGTRKNLAEARGEYRQLSGETKKAFNSMEASAKQSTTRLTDIIKGSAIGGLIASGARKAVSVVSGAVDDAIKRVDTLNNSTKAYENMGIKASTAKKANEDLLKAIDGLPTALDEATKSQQLLTSSMDNDVGQATKVFKAMNDSILGFGGSADQVNEAVTQLSQAFSNGKVDGQTWNSMINAQMGPTLNAIAKKMHMTTGELKDGLSQGKISVKEFQDQLVEMDNKGGGGLKSLNKIAKDSTDGIGTAMQNMHTKIVSSLANVMQGLQKAGLSKYINQLSSSLGKSGDAFKEMGLMAGKALQALVSLIPPLIQIAKPLGDIAITMGKAVFETFVGVIKAIAAPFGLLAKNTSETSKHLNPIASFFEMIAKQKETISAVAKVMAGMFVAKKVTEFSTALTEFGTKAATNARNRVTDLKNIRQQLLGIQTDSAKATAALTTVEGGSSKSQPQTRMGKNHGVDIAPTETAGKTAGTKFAKGFKFASSTGIGAAMSALPALTSKDPNVEKAGTATGSVLGAAIGATMGPIGAMIGGQIGGTLGKAMSKSINKNIDLEALTLRLKQPFSVFFDWFEKQGSASASKATKSMEKSFNGFMKGRKDNAIKVKVDTKDVDKAASDMKKKYADMGKSVDTYYKKQKDSGKKTLDQQLKDGQISKKDYDTRLKRLNDNLDKEKSIKTNALGDQLKAEQSYYDKVKDISTGNTKKLLEIAQQYGVDSKQYKQEEAKEKKKVDEEYAASSKKANQSANKNKLTDEEKAFKRMTDIQKDYGKRKKKLSVKERLDAANEASKELLEIGKIADKTYKKSVSTAEKKYKENVKNAKYQRDELGTISQSEYDEIVKKSKDAKDKSIKDAKEKRDKTTKEAEKQRDKTVKAAADAGKKTPKELEKQKKNELKKQEEGNKKLRKNMSDFGKSISKIWRETWGGISKFFGGIFDGLKKTASTGLNWIKKKCSDVCKGISKIWHDTWDGISKFFGGIWNGIKGTTDKGTKWVQNKVSDFNKSVSDGWHNTWNGLSNFFTDIWNGIKDKAKDGMNGVIGIVNKGIDGINGMISSFGGDKTTIKRIPKFATGTSNWRDVMGRQGAGAPPGLAMVNDGNGAEAIVYPDGSTVVPTGRNVVMPMMGGETVIPHEQAAKAGLVVPNAYKNGVGDIMGAIGKSLNSGAAWAGKAFNGGKSFIADILDDVKDMVKDFTGGLKSAWNFVQDPKKAFTNMVAPVTGGKGSFGSSITKMGKKQIDSFGGAWTGEVANAVKDIFSGGGSSSGGGKGDDYNPKWRNAAKDAYADNFGYYIRECVSFVANRLNNLGVNPKLFSHLGNGSDWTKAPVQHRSKPKLGDVAVYAGGSKYGNHVSIVTGVNGNKFNEEGYNAGNPPNGKYYKTNGLKISDATTFLNFGAKSRSSVNEDSGDEQKSGLRGLVEKQAKKALDNITSMFDDVSEKYADSGVQAVGNGKGVMGHSEFNRTAKKAAGIIGEKLSSHDLAVLYHQAMTESNVNPSINTGYNDHDGTGTPKGLFQYKNSTFAAYAYKNHRNILSALDQFLAVFNNSTWRSDFPPLGTKMGWGPRGTRRFANGGLISRPELVMAGEEGPEFIIPTDTARKSRANQLLDQAYKTVNGNNHQTNTASNSADVEQLVHGVNNLVSMMSSLLGISQEQLMTMQNSNKNGNGDFFNAMANAQTLSNFQSI
ncbi:tape measure protein [Weissella viridescens]|uniref:tape measure protein n=1 Tax=Weissella viridescens TaxID=1629 RepID=UPI003AF21E86